MEQKTNKTIVAEFYKNVIGLRKAELIPNYIHENYIQHSPMGKDGREGLIMMVDFLKTLPQPEVIKSPIVKMIEEGDYVVVHINLMFMGKHTVLIELFRLQDGMAAEHWDVTEEQNGQREPIINIKGVSNDLDLTPKDFITDLYARYEDITIHHIIEEDDYIAVHSELKEAGNLIALFDIFKIEGKQITSHDYVKQYVPETMMHSNGMF